LKDRKDTKGSKELRSV